MDWIGLPPLTALRAFAAFAEAGTTLAAGAKLNVSHAAVSQQIKALEAHMGVPLVTREGRTLVLTEDGRILAEVLVGGFSKIETVIRAMTGQSDARALQISTTPSFAAHWLMPRLVDFRAKHAHVDLMMNATPEPVALKSGGTDLAIRFGAGHWDGCEAELLIPSDIVVVASPDLVGKGALRQLSDLKNYDWISEQGLNEVSDWLRRHGVEDGRAKSVTYVSGNMLLDAARLGQGVISMARLFVEEDIQRGRLALLYEEPRGGSPTGYYLVSRKGAPLRPVAKAFATWLKGAVKSR